MPRYQYNTSRKEATASAMSQSAIGKGLAGDAGQARESVVSGVKETLMKRMKHANRDSNKKATALYQKVDDIIKYYNSELSSIASAEETKQNLQKKIAQKEAEKNSFQESESYKTNKREHNISKEDYSKKKKAVSLEKHMRHRQKKLPDKEALLASHANVLVEFRKQNLDSQNLSKKEKKQAELRYAEGYKDWERERAEVVADHNALAEYENASEEHLTKDYYKRIKNEQKNAKKRYKDASAAYKADKAIIRTLTIELNQDSAELLDVLKMQSSRELSLLDSSANVRGDLLKEIDKHQTESEKYSTLHDKAAIQYYILTRGQSAKKTGNDLEIPGHNKDVAKYVGRPTLTPMTIQRLLHNIRSNPGDSHKISVNNMTDASNPADERHITHDKLISMTDDGKTYRMDSKYTIQPDTSAGGAASGTQPQKLKDLTSLSINRTEDKTKRYISTAHTLSLQTVATGSILHKQEVSGLWIQGEFIPANGSHSESITDVRKSYQKKMTSGGAFDQDDKLALAIRNSELFRHIYAENIEHYTRYPGDDGIDAIALSDTVSSGAAPDLASVKTSFKDAKEDEKALTLFQYRNSDYFNDLLTDTTLLSGKPKERVVAKLVHAMLALNKDRDRAIEIAQTHGSNELKQIAQGAKVKDYASLFYACSAIIHGASASTFEKFLAGAEKFKDGTEEFLDGDGPFLKGTAAEGLINYDQIKDVYESINNMYGLASKKVQNIQALENQLSDLTEGSEQYQSVEKQKEEAERDLEHGIGGDVLGLVSSIKDIFFSFKNIWEMIKDKRLLSEDNAAEKDLGSLYVSWMDYIFDIGNAILSPMDALLGLLSNKLLSNIIVGLDSASPVGEVVSVIKDIFKTLESGYHLIQNSRKSHNITKSMDTITSDTNLRSASEENPQVIYYLGRARNKTGKDIAENVIDVTTGAANSAGHFTGTLGSKIINITTTAISTLGKLITNGIYNGKEKSAALKTAFGDAYATYKSNPNFDRILKMTAGINSLKHLVVVSRIFAAIDTHHMLKAAPSGSFEFNLAKTAMSAFYKPKQLGVDPAKEGFDLLPLSAILKHVGEGTDWRSKLTAAIR